MNDISPELKHEWIVRALDKVGFEEMPAPGIFAKKHGNDKILVDLNEKPPCAIFIIDGKRDANDDVNETLVKINQIIIDAENGVMPTDNEQEATPEQPEDVQNEPLTDQMQRELIDVPSSTDKINPPAVREPTHALTPHVPSDLSVQTIKKYINDKATDEEAYVFLQLCKARGLNPFLKEAYLIKYDHVSPATMVVGKDAFMKRAELHSQYNGFEAGIITDKKEWKVGTFLNESEKLLGGWAKVYRKDREHPVVITVSMSEFNTGKSSWKKIPATMIRKVALVQGHREAFPSELSGMYDQSEMGVEVIT